MKRWRAFLRLIEPFAGDEARALRREASLLTRDLGASRDAQAACDAFADIAKAAARQEAKNGAGKNGGKSGAKNEATVGTRAAAALRLQRQDAPDHRQQARDVARRGGKHRARPSRAEAADGSHVARARRRRKNGRSKPSPFPILRSASLGPIAARGGGGPMTGARRRTRICTNCARRWSRCATRSSSSRTLWPRMLRIFASELQRLRSQLGKANDLAVLRGFVEPHAPLSRWRKPISSHAATRRDRHTERAERIAGRVFSETPRAFRRRLVALWQAAQQHPALKINPRSASFAQGRRRTPRTLQALGQEIAHQRIAEEIGRGAAVVSAGSLAAQAVPVGQGAVAAAEPGQRHEVDLFVDGEIPRSRRSRRVPDRRHGLRARAGRRRHWSRRQFR